LHHQQPPLTPTQSPLETEEYTEKQKQKQKEEGKAETEERKGSDRGKKIYTRRTTAAATVLPLHLHSTPPDRR
jgi:hypothetical protein